MPRLRVPLPYREAPPRHRRLACARRTRRVWDNPILWREVRTWAYGRKMLIVRLAYLVLFAASAAGLHWTLAGQRTPGLAELSLPLVPLFVLSLVLVNVQAVTSLTTERDARAFDLLLVTDLTPREFIFGKLAGVLYNTKEMVLLPMALCVYLASRGTVSVENLLYLVGGWLVMVGFVAMLGVHCGMNYANSRAAIAVSVGTVFFLFVGVATCMRIMVAFSGSFQFQLQPFLAFMVGGGVGLFVALGWSNASTAIWIAAFACPFATFYALTSFLLDYTLAVFLVVAATYGFTTAAMLMPAHLRIRRGHRPDDRRRRLTAENADRRVLNAEPCREWLGDRRCGVHRSIAWRPRQARLAVIAQRLEHGQHFVVRDEAAAVHQLVGIDRVGQFLRLADSSSWLSANWRRSRPGGPS